eukprot:GHVN01098451.1.p1 GENE.GHVN01098451.1~~GHVN01098451.1.p1  ORF type:complete len:599 (-),score=28.85 GHVN01098451.1:222-2018(-)
MENPLHETITSDSAQRMSITLKELSCTLERGRGQKKQTKQILKNINGTFQKGKMTAILGASGAGKTTLLNTIAGNTDGKISGSILVNGNKIKPSKMKRFSGFVLQEDILFETMTVRESLLMSATFRLPSETTMKEINGITDEILEKLLLLHCKDTIIGATNNKGISGGEKKRTSIGMEMITNPTILFLDEPTSGLDTFTAYSVISKLNELSRQGRTVVATIHQPSSEIFYLFDEIIFLMEGQVIYWGETLNVVPYFSSLGFACPTYTNPADYFFMTLLSSASEGNDASFLSSRNERLHCMATKWASRPCEPIEITPIEERATKNRASPLRQYFFLQKRAFRNVVRDKRLFLIRLGQCLFNSILVSLIFSDIRAKTPFEIARSLRGCLYFMITNQIFGGASSTATLFAAEKLVFIKEYRAGYYQVFPYYISKLLAEIPAQMSLSIIMSVLLHIFVPLRKDILGITISTLFLCLAYMDGFMIGVVISSLFEKPLYTTSVLPLVIFPLMLTGGIYGATSSKVEWIKYISPIRYAIDSIVKNELSGMKIAGTDVTGIVYEAGFSFPNLLLNAYILLVFFVVFFISGYVLLLLSVKKKRHSLE